MNKAYGNLSGLRAEDIKRIEKLYRRRLPPEAVVTQELARNLTEISHDINRQIGILITRRGEVAFVIVGTHKDILIPGLDGYRSSGTRLKGLRLVHTHLNSEGLSTDDLTDLALLRLDLVCAVETQADGLPGLTHTAHLVPENPEGTFWLFLERVPPSQLNLNFLAFITALEAEFSRQQRLRKVGAADRAVLVRVETNPLFDSEGALEELRELARSAGVEVFGTVLQHRTQVDPRFVLGKGKLSDVVIKALQMDANLLIFDHELTPIQIRSIADFTQVTVIDRTQLILDIFAQRAHSREGKLQVELAQLKYRLPRLVRRDAALSRLAGGIGSRGPGETKLEIDRRRIRERIHRLQKELQGIGKARDQRRVKRERTGLPVISIVGYTNAGKSTLINALTNSSTHVEDRLFATLDPKSARLRFPRDTEAVITDTVGFIRDLPADLFAAFRATLDELQEADVLLHVIDVSTPVFESHIGAVERILSELGLSGKPVIRVFNKEDRVADKEMLATLCRRFGAVAVSALKPATLAPLLEELQGVIGGDDAVGRGDGSHTDPDEAFPAG